MVNCNDDKVRSRGIGSRYGAQLWHAKLIQKPHLFRNLTISAEGPDHASAEFVHTSISGRILIGGNRIDTLHLMPETAPLKFGHYGIHKLRNLHDQTPC